MQPVDPHEIGLPHIPVEPEVGQIYKALRDFYVFIPFWNHNTHGTGLDIYELKKGVHFMVVGNKSVGQQELNIAMNKLLILNGSATVCFTDFYAISEYVKLIENSTKLS